VDLFASYGLTQKAIGLLEAILRRAPSHTPTLEKLLDFVLGAGDDRRTAELAAQLERIHRDRGETADAERFGELRRRFQRAAGLSDEEMAAAAAPQATAEVASEDSSDSEASLQELPVPMEEAAPVKAAAPPPPPPPPKPAAPAAPVHEVDLSDEWASMLTQGAAADTKESKSVVAPPPPAAKVPPAAVQQTPAASAPQEFEIAEFSVPDEPPAAAHAEAPAEVPVSADDPAFEILSVDDESEGEPLPPRAPQTPATPEAAEDVPEIVLDQEYELVLSPEPETEGSVEPAQAAKPKPSQVLNTDQFLAELADEIDQLGLDQLSPPVPEPAAAKEAAPVVTARAESPAAPAENEPLKEVFEEFRAELGEMGAEDEDLETHYNLGIAFREMGLVEEAISEFQKVAKATEKGKPFPYVMQCFTLLGVAFTEKGQPGIAAIWYERALHAPGVDAESTLALRYDLGVAQESANDLDAALKSFSQVYAVNIDYRDVADRIAALQKTTR
jgi:tetratricopeptide (TPR) repeat protein